METNEYRVMYELEEKHAWFKAKRKMILELINKFSKPGSKVLDLGCGTGVICNKLSENYNVTGLDNSKEALKYARKRNNKLKLIQGEAQNLKFKKNTFNVVVASDIIEHLNEDHKAIKNIFRVLKRKGVVIITVPAFEFLWGKDDVMLEHKRRYTKKQIKVLLKQTGFKILLLNYWNFLAFPLAIIYKRINKEQSVIKFNKALNNIAYFMWRFEGKLLHYLRIPFGVSIVAVAHKE